MDFADSPEHAAFRAEFRHWLEEHLPPEICVDDAADQRVAPDRETLGKRIAWQKKMHAAGWVGTSWPREYSGRGAGFMQQVIFDEEYFRACAPVLPTASALNLLGPTLKHWGTEEQELLRDTARRFLESECNTQFVRQRMAEPAPVTDAFWEKLAEQGRLGIVYPEKEGGSGLGLVDLIVLMEETGSAVMPAHSSRPS